MKQKIESIRRFRVLRNRTSRTFIAFLCLAAMGVQAANLAYWRFESGNPGADASGNNHTLNLTGVTTAADVAPGAPGASSAIFGGTAFAKTAATLDLSNLRTLTLEFFAKSTQTDLGMICEHGPDFSGVNGAFYCDFNEGGAKFRLAQYSGGFNVIEGGAPVRDGNWHHYAATMDNRGPNAVLKLYVDGNLLASVTQGPSAPGINDIFNIGSRDGLALFYNGSLDEMRLSDRILDPAAFLGNQYQDVTFGITQQPTNTTVMESTPVTFAVAASATNAPDGVLEYQWLRDNVEIPGAIGATYTIPVTRFDTDNNAQFSVRITAAGILLTDMVISDAAKLTVIKDVTPPELLATYAPAANFVTLVFDGPLDPDTATSSWIYSLNGGASVESASLAEDHLVVLKVWGLSSPTYTVSFTGIKDLAGNEASGLLTGDNKSGFEYEDIGTVALPGFVYAENTEQTVMAATGVDIWSGADGMGYLYTSLTGDFDLRLRVEGMGGIFNNDTRGGLMVREDIGLGSRNIAALTYANAGNWVVTARTKMNGTTTIPGFPEAGLIRRTSPYPDAWLRIMRSGNTFQTFYSTNNLDWVSLDGGSIVPAEPFAETLLVGMASSQISVSGGGAHATFTYSGFQNYVATEGTIVINTQPADATVLELHPVTFSVAATLEGGDSSVLRYQWLTNGVEVAGATRRTLTFATSSRALSGLQVRCVVSAGPSIAPVASDVATLTVTPDTAGPVTLSVSASVLDPNTVIVIFDELVDANTANDVSRYALDGGHYLWGAALQPDGRTVVLSGDGVNAPQFQLTYTGITDLVGNASSQTVPGTVYHFDWSLVDIQDAYATTTSIIGATPNGATLQSQRGDIWGAVDSCAFMYQPMTNDFDVCAQIVNITGGANWSRGGLMARVSTEGDSPNLMVGSYSPAQENYVWTARATAGGATTYGLGLEKPNFPNVWVRMQRVGNTFTGYHSTDGYHWQQFGEITDMQAEEVMLVGIGFSTCMVNDATLGNFHFDHFGPTVLLPELQIEQVGANVVLRWPASTEGFQLEQTSALGAEMSWNPVSTTPTVDGDWRQMTLPMGGSSFYRLVK